MKKSVLKNKIRKKIVSLMLASSMLVTSLGNGGAGFTALAQTTKDTDYNRDVSANVQEDCNSEIYDHLEDYPTGELLEDFSEVTDEVITNVEEYEQQMLINEGNCEGAQEEIKNSLVSYASSVDLSESEYAPNIVSQLGGSCANYSGTYYVGTYTINKARGISSKSEENTLSPMFVYNRVRSAASTSYGTTIKKNAQFLIDNGAPYQSLAPSSTSVKNYQYTWYPTEEIWEDAANNRIDSANYMTLFSRTGTPITSPDDSDLELMKKTLSDGKMIAFGTHFYTFNYTKIAETSESHPNEQIVSRCDYYVGSATKRNYGAHGMVIVGYDDNIWVDINYDGIQQEAELGAIKIANSHGTDYKNNGYVWVAYDAINKVSAVLTSEDETRINQAIEEGTIEDNAVSAENRCAFLPGNYGQEAIYTCTNEKSSSDVFLVASVKTADRVDLVLKIKAKNKNTGDISTYNTDYNLRYSATSTASWPTSYSLDGSTTEKEGTIAFDLNTVISDITLEEIDEYEWSVSMYDRDTASNPVTITDLSIKSKGAVLYTAELSNQVLTGTATDYALSKSHTLLNSFDWDYAENESSVGKSRKLTATIKTTDEVTYKFEVIDENDIVTTLKDYSVDNSVKWTPSSTGTYTLTVYAKNSAGDVDTMNKSVKINSAPKIASVRFDQEFPRAVGSTITANITYEGGTGTVNCDMYVMGGNASDTAKTIYFTNVSNTQKTWVPDTDGTYTLYASITDASGLSTLQKIGSYEVIKSNQVTIYYKNSGWSQAYVHYKVDGKGWTSVPGVKMSDSRTAVKAGYTWKATIDLGSASKITMCFNDKNGNWDNNNRKNYIIDASGTYGIKDKKITKMDTQTATPTPKPVEETTFYYDNSKTNWSNVYVYAWSDGVSAKMFTGTKETSSIYKFTISNTYTKVLFKNVNSTSTWDKQTVNVGEPQEGKVFIPSSASNKTSGVWENYGGETPTPTPVDDTMFYYNNSKTNWSKVYAYVWADGVSAKVYEGTKVATNVYQFSIPKKYTNVLFKNTSGTNNWDKQTDHVLIQSADGYIFIPNSSSNKTSGKWEIQQ